MTRWGMVIDFGKCIGCDAGGAREAVLAIGAVPLIPQGFLLRLVTLHVGVYPPVR